MQAQNDMPTSGQVDPKYKAINQKQNAVIPFVINGCTVSFSTGIKADEPIKAVKEILLSAYGSRMARC
jgi:hypothetical protein